MMFRVITRLPLSTRLLARSMAQEVGKDWNYKDQSAWGNVATKGKRQSPIDIQSSLVKTDRNLTSLKLEGWECLQNGAFVNTGHSLQFTPSTDDNPATLITPHGDFAFKQFHFHWGPTSALGAEHKIDGYSYATEIHFVHVKKSVLDDAEDSIAVLGVLCYANNENTSESSPSWQKIKFPQEPGDSVCENEVDMSKYLPKSLDYYYYKGSLTTPPCSETVLWYVFKQPLEVPEDFLEKLRQMKDATGQKITHNYRQCMPLNDRLVKTPLDT